MGKIQKGRKEPPPGVAGGGICNRRERPGGSPSSGLCPSCLATDLLPSPLAPVPLHRPLFFPTRPIYQVRLLSLSFSWALYYPLRESENQTESGTASLPLLGWVGAGTTGLQVGCEGVPGTRPQAHGGVGGWGGASLSQELTLTDSVGGKCGSLSSQLTQICCLKSQ